MESESLRFYFYVFFSVVLFSVVFMFIFLFHCIIVYVTLRKDNKMVYFHHDSAGACEHTIVFGHQNRGTPRAQGRLWERWKVSLFRLPEGYLSGTLPVIPLMFL